jgi:hypothetical protein
MMPCEHNEGDSCTGWNPSSSVYLYEGVYYVDYSFIAGLLAGPAPLFDCDDAYFAANTSDEWVLHDCDSGELLYELGWRDGYRPFKINGWPLLNRWGTYQAIMWFWMVQGETDYTVEYYYDTPAGPQVGTLAYSVYYS